MPSADLLPTLSPETLLAFTAAMLVLALTPGPGFLAVVARAMSQGFGAGLAATAGLVLGDLLFLALAILGLSALAAVLGEFFLVVKWLGAAYLVWLGIALWRSDGAAAQRTAPEGPRPKASHRGSLALGFLVTLGNPKVILFYGAFLPTFVDLAALTLGDVVLLGVVVAAALFAVLGAYAFLAARAGRVMKNSRAQRWLNRVTGGILVGAGVAVATR
ncbi:MAG TPA: LysE family translocator [Kiloniellaceae bacterium]|nr:LysE family translocator [Kiloniellaceae bacterium]HIP80250.1 LysE family translocator [Kiloniellaceae bacterium]